LSKLGKTCTETYNMIKIAFGEDFMNCTQVFEWSHHFKDGGRSAESDECPR
jgi:hypothetical protein